MPEVNNLFNQIRTANQRSSSKLLTTRRERKGKESHLSFQVVTHNLSADVAHLSSPARETPDALSHLEKRTDDSPPLMMLLTVCISAHLVFTVLEQAAVVGCQAFIRCMNVISYKSCIMPLSGLVEMALFSNAAVSLSSPAVPRSRPQSSKDTPGLISLGTKEPSAGQQGHTVVDAATRSTTHLVQTNLQHGSSRGRDRMFEHTTHFRTVTLFWLANGG
eukprot:Em0014g629a